MAFTNGPASLLLWLGLACAGAAAAKKVFDKCKKANQNSWKKEDDKEGEKTDKGLRVSDLKTILLQSPVIQWVLSMTTKEKFVFSKNYHKTPNDYESNDDGNKETEDFCKQTVLNTNERIENRDCKSLLSETSDRNLFKKVTTDALNKNQAVEKMISGDQTEKENNQFNQAAILVNDFEIDSDSEEPTVDNKANNFKQLLTLSESCETGEIREETANNAMVGESFDLSKKEAKKSESNQSFDKLVLQKSLEVDLNIDSEMQLSVESVQRSLEFSKDNEHFKELKPDETKQDSLDSDLSEFSVVDVEEELTQFNLRSLDVTSDLSMITLRSESDVQERDHDSAAEVFLPVKIEDKKNQSSHDQENESRSSVPDGDTSQCEESVVSFPKPETRKNELKSSVVEPQSLLQIATENSEVHKPEKDEQLFPVEDKMNGGACHIIKQTVTDICRTVDDLVEDSIKQSSPESESGKTSLIIPLLDNSNHSKQQQSHSIATAADLSFETEESAPTFYGSVLSQAARTPFQMTIQMMVGQGGSSSADTNSVVEDMDVCDFKLFIKNLENLSLKNKTKFYIKATLASGESGGGRRKMKTPLIRPSSSISINKTMEFQKISRKLTNGVLLVSILPNTTFGAKKKIGSVEIKLAEKIGLGKNKDLTVGELLTKKKGSWLDALLDFK